MIIAPDRIKSFNLVKLGGDDGKKPFEKGWQKKVYRMDNPKMVEWLAADKNYGVQSNNSVDEKDKFLVVVDFDTRAFQDLVINQFPETFTTTSGSPKKCWHLWFISNENKAFKIFDEGMNTLCDVIGKGNQVVGPGSEHKKSGSIYSVVKDIPLAFIPYSQLEAILLPHDKTPKEEIKPAKVYVQKGLDDKINKDITGSISMKQALEECGVDTSRSPTACPFHVSVGGKCLSWNNEVAHCFNCQKGKKLGWNAFSFIRKAKNFTDKETFDWFAEKAGKTAELKESRREYAKKREADSMIPGVLGQTTIYRQLAADYYKKQPFYYDDADLWWFWDSEKFCWVIKNKTDIMLKFDKYFTLETEKGNVKEPILEALRKCGREHKPEDVKPTWIQFKDKVYDIADGTEFKATPKYFIANPIDWKVGESEETPTIDKLFRQWVAPEDVPRLYELMAFIPLPKYFIHSFFFLYSPPGMGKGTYVDLIIKFIGRHNCTATSIKRINANPRFESYYWHKKLLVTMSEVSNINELRDSAVINNATGGDPMRAEAKNGGSFDYVNYGKFIYPTNKLLKVDPGDGFGRRVRVIKFITRFEKEKDVLETIPAIEFENLARKCLRLCKDLHISRRFTGDVDISDRIAAYQEMSKTPLNRFLDECCDLTDFDARIRFDEFYAAFVKYLAEKRLGTVSKRDLGKELRDLKYEPSKEHWKNEQQNLGGFSESSEQKWTKHLTLRGILLLNNKSLVPMGLMEPTLQLTPIEKTSSKDGTKSTIGTKELVEDTIFDLNSVEVTKVK